MITTENKNSVLVMEHNHDGDETAIKAVKCKSRIKILAKTIQDEPGQINTQTALAMEREARTYFVPRGHCKRLIRHHQRAPQSCDSATLEEVVSSGQWASTGGREQQSFLIYDNGPHSDNHINAFASEQTLLLLARSDLWMMDRNFTMAPP